MSFVFELAVVALRKGRLTQVTTVAPGFGFLFIWATPAAVWLTVDAYTAYACRLDLHQIDDSPPRSVLVLESDLSLVTASAYS